MTETIRIGLDVAALAYPPSGVRAYVEALIDAYRNRDSGIELVPMAAPGSTPGRPGRLARLRWDLRGVAQFAAEAQVDLLHMTRFAAPRQMSRPLVVTVHDLIPLLLPEYRRTNAARVQSDLARRTVARATRVIVPTGYVAADVELILKVPRDRIDIIPMGVDIPSDWPLPRPIDRPYIVHAGGFDVRKNLPVLLRAFAEAGNQLQSSWRLVLIGAPHTANPAVYPPIQPLIQQLELADRVILTGRISDREKDAWYQHATIAVAPSISEGFGLPILEAMAHGAPVIASNRTSHPEVAGDAAVLVEPSVEALRDALVWFGSNPAIRDDYRDRGRRRAAEYSWKRTATLTLATYRRAVEERPA